MMTMFKALAGQPWSRVVVKAAVSFLVVGLSTLVSREGLALAVIIIFTGITGPAIRLVSLKMDGVYDRIIVSPVNKARFFVTFAGLWSVAALIPLIPSIMVVVVARGTVTVIPAVIGTGLAAVLGTLVGIATRGLSEAHVAAIIAAAVLVLLTVFNNPVSAFIPYPALTSPSYGSFLILLPAGLLAAAIALLALTATRDPGRSGGWSA